MLFTSSTPYTVLCSVPVRAKDVLRVNKTNTPTAIITAIKTPGAIAVTFFFHKALKSTSDLTIGFYSVFQSCNVSPRFRSHPIYRGHGVYPRTADTDRSSRGNRMAVRSGIWDNSSS